MIHVHLSLCTYVSVSMVYIPRSKISGSTLILQNFHHKTLYPLVCSPTMYERDRFLTSCPGITTLFNLCQLEVKVAISSSFEFLNYEWSWVYFYISVSCFCSFSWTICISFAYFQIELSFSYWFVRFIFILKKLAIFFCMCNNYFVQLIGAPE